MDRVVAAESHGDSVELGVIDILGQEHADHCSFHSTSIGVISVIPLELLHNAITCSEQH